MAPANTDNSVFRYVDWFTVVLYLILVVAGVISIYAANYDFDHASIFSFDEFSGKQIKWIGLSLFIALIILLVDYRVYETYAYPLYLAFLVILVLTIFLSTPIKGSHSWIKLGSMSIQPAEFAKCATSLALAKLFSEYNFSIKNNRRNLFKALAIIFVPILIILGQRETGSALAYLALFFVLYREGMSGMVLLAATAAVVIFVVAVKYSTMTFLSIPLGEAIVMMMLMAMMVAMVALYAKRIVEARNLLLGFIISAVPVFILHLCGIKVHGYLYFFATLGAAVVYCLAMWLHKGYSRLGHVVGVIVVALAFLFSVNYALNNVLQPHQQMRIKVVLGIEDDPRGVGYNVNQSKIAIGSGGLVGKGFLNGTQTKLKYVPEQHTDFIFCTIGEEEGFLGASAVLILLTVFILRIISLAERQTSTFGRVYGYCVASILIFHVLINVGMVIGLCPVIGIPLPLFSYGGSSLWGFTCLLFILLRLDAARKA